MPYRVASPPPPEPDELEEPYVAVIRAGQRRAWLTLGALVAFTIGAAVLVRTAARHLTPRSSLAAISALDTLGARETIDARETVDAPARRALDDARADAAREQHHFEHAIREAIVRADALPPLTHCRGTLPPAWELSKSHPSLSLLVLERSDVGGSLPSQAIARRLASLGRAEARLALHRPRDLDAWAENIAKNDLDREVVLLATTRRTPEARSGHEYAPGEIEGRAFVYDFETRSVVCAGAVAARSSAEVGYVYASGENAPASTSARARMSDALDEDLRFQLERAIVAAIGDDPAP